MYMLPTVAATSEPWEINRNGGLISGCIHILFILFPYAPCMVYLPLLTYISFSLRANVAKYSIHGAYGVGYGYCMLLPSLFSCCLFPFGKLSWKHYTMIYTDLKSYTQQ